MSFRDEVYKHYCDQDGMITVDRDPSPRSTQNGLLYLGIFMTILALRGELTSADNEHFLKAVRDCEVAEGVFARNPGLENFESHDDYVGIAAGSYLTGAPFAKHIVDHGHESGWRFDNTGKAGVEAWHGRFIGRTAFYKMCAGEDLSGLDSLALNSGIRGAIDTPASDAGAKLLMWPQVVVAKIEGHLPIACELFENNINESYGSVNGLFAKYFGESHPFAGAFKGAA